MNPLLDSRASMTELDPKGMLQLTEEFPMQCRTAIDIAMAAALPTGMTVPRAIVLTGLGGSAAGGDFIRAVMEAESTIPFAVNRDYHLPRYVGPDVLVFCCSYSGNTEETLSAYREAKVASATVIAVTSGGELEALATKAGDTVIKVPGGQPPRTAMGFMMLPVLVAMDRLGLVDHQDYDGLVEWLEACAEKWGVQITANQNEAKQIAQEFHAGVPILYGLGPQMAVVANRWKCQVHENAKLLAFTNAFPELNHNEILGWIGAPHQGVHKFTGVIFEDCKVSTKMAARAKVTRGLIGDTCSFRTVVAEGPTLLARLLGTAFMGDFVTIYLARLAAVDPETIPYIDQLKLELAQIPG